MFILDSNLHSNVSFIADEHLAIIMSKYIGLLRQGQNLGDLLSNISIKEIDSENVLRDVIYDLNNDVKWVLDCKDNWYFLYNSVTMIYNEYQLRYKSKSLLSIYKQALILNPPPIYLHTGEINTCDIIEISRQFYKDRQSKLTWTNRKKPIWL